MKLGALLSDHRKANKISLRKLAKEIGIETTSLYRFEGGRSVSTEKWVAIMMWVLGK